MRNTEYGERVGVVNTNSRKAGSWRRAASHGTMARLLRRRRMKTRTRPMALVPMRVASATMRCSASRCSAGTTAGDSHTSVYSGRRPNTSAPKLVLAPSMRHCSTLKLRRSSSSGVRATSGWCVHRYSATATISRAFLSASLGSGPDGSPAVVSLAAESLILLTHTARGKEGRRKKRKRRGKFMPCRRLCVRTREGRGGSWRERENERRHTHTHTPHHILSNFSARRFFIKRTSTRMVSATITQMSRNVITPLSPFCTVRAATASTFALTACTAWSTEPTLRATSAVMLSCARAAVRRTSSTCLLSSFLRLCHHKQ